jgi:hypothetical protein
MADVAMEIWGKAAGGRRDGGGGICKMTNVGGVVNPTSNPTIPPSMGDCHYLSKRFRPDLGRSKSGLNRV